MVTADMTLHSMHEDQVRGGNYYETIQTKITCWADPLNSHKKAAMDTHKGDS